MNALTAEWVAKADDDFHAADLLQHAGEEALLTASRIRQFVRGRLGLE